VAATICPRPTLTFDLLTLKSAWESHVTWGTPVQSFVFLGLLVFELEPMYATSDRQTDGRRKPSHRLMHPPPPLRGGGITSSSAVAKRPRDASCLFVVSFIAPIVQYLKRNFYAPPRRGAGALSGDRRPSSVRLSVCLMSRTSALSRKPKGLGRRSFAQGYPRSHATPTPTSRSKGQKSRSRGQLVHRSEMCQYFANG